MLACAELKLLFSKPEIGNIYYNRSLDYVQFAEQCFDKGEVSRANKMIIYLANSGMRNAQLYYAPLHDKICNEQFQIYEELHHKYLVALGISVEEGNQPIASTKYGCK